MPYGNPQLYEILARSRRAGRPPSWSPEAHGAPSRLDSLAQALAANAGRGRGGRAPHWSTQLAQAIGTVGGLWSASRSDKKAAEAAEIKQKEMQEASTSAHEDLANLLANPTGREAGPGVSIPLQAPPGQAEGAAPPPSMPTSVPGREAHRLNPATAGYFSQNPGELQFRMSMHELQRRRQPANPLDVPFEGGEQTFFGPDPSAPPEYADTPRARRELARRGYHYGTRREEPAAEAFQPTSIQMPDGSVRWIRSAEDLNALPQGAIPLADADKIADNVRADRKLMQDAEEQNYRRQLAEAKAEEPVHWAPNTDQQDRMRAAGRMLRGVDILMDVNPETGESYMFDLASQSGQLFASLRYEHPGESFPQLMAKLVEKSPMAISPPQERAFRAFYAINAADLRDLSGAVISASEIASETTQGMPRPHATKDAIQDLFMNVIGEKVDSQINPMRLARGADEVLTQYFQDNYGWDIAKPFEERWALTRAEEQPPAPLQPLQAATYGQNPPGVPQPLEPQAEEAGFWDRAAQTGQRLLGGMSLQDSPFGGGETPRPAVEDRPIGYDGVLPVDGRIPDRDQAVEMARRAGAGLIGGAQGQIDRLNESLTDMGLYDGPAPPEPVPLPPQGLDPGVDGRSPYSTPGGPRSGVPGVQPSLVRDARNAAQDVIYGAQDRIDEWMRDPQEAVPTPGRGMVPGESPYSTPGGPQAGVPGVQPSLARDARNAAQDLAYGVQDSIDEWMQDPPHWFEALRNDLDAAGTSLTRRGAQIVAAADVGWKRFAEGLPSFGDDEDPGVPVINIYTGAKGMLRQVWLDEMPGLGYRRMTPEEIEQYFELGG